MNAATPPALLTTSQHLGWRATLDLRIDRRDARSVLAHRLHEGPLRVQKALYPEGHAVCQILILHPPAGIAGGDALQLQVKIGSGAHAQLTTPGAGKWYRANGREATQDIRLHVEADAILEWLPQEAIIYNEAQARSSATVTLAPSARAIGWDILCLGRRASGERFEQGQFSQQLRLQRPNGTPLWRESMRLLAGSETMHSQVGLAGHSVTGTMWIAGIAPDADLNAALRELSIPDVRFAVSALPDVTVVRLLAHCSEAARFAFEAAWRIARPRVLAREALRPRIWAT